jgi:hypothetical protein
MLQESDESGMMGRSENFLIVGIFLSLPSWQFIGAMILWKGEIDDHVMAYALAGLGSCLSTSCGILSFIHSRGDTDVVDSDILWILWAALPYFLIPLLVLLYMTGSSFYSP